MNLELARRLNSLTQEFYTQVEESFSQSRQQPWEGWERVVDALGSLPHPISPKSPLLLLDVACGNLRFEHFLSSKRIPLDVLALDSSNALVMDGMNKFGGEAEVTLKHRAADIASALAAAAAEEDPQADDDAGSDADGSATTSATTPTPAASSTATQSESDAISRFRAGFFFQGTPLGYPLHAKHFDLCVSFGFMHHLPLPAQRELLLRAMCDACAPGGIVAASFWQFAQDEIRRQKAEASTAQACLELGIDGLDTGDYLLGWKQETSVWRYCHSFTEAEIDMLVAGVSDTAEEIARYSADGATGEANRYLILRALS